MLYAKKRGLEAQYKKIYIDCKKIEKDIEELIATDGGWKQINLEEVEVNSM